MAAMSDHSTPLYDNITAAEFPFVLQQAWTKVRCLESAEGSARAAAAALEDRVRELRGLRTDVKACLPALTARREREKRISRIREHAAEQLGNLRSLVDAREKGMNEAVGAAEELKREVERLEGEIAGMCRSVGFDGPEETLEAFGQEA